ncbi:MFS transporter [Nocardia sp. AB354]|uniref:MFS transporter n=1 Tax=Nocardia sp. AB354 TaxID=3413283 RepID=UPI003C13DA9C
MVVESPRPGVIKDHRWAGWMAVSAVCLGAFMGQLDASIVTLTFPAVQREFGAPLASVQWVSLGYLVTLVGLVVAAGRVSDAAGRKFVYLQGFVVFTLASGLCAAAPNLWWLIGFRVLQAVGAAMLQANSVALVATSVAAHRIRAALGVHAGAQALGLALGPLVGGVVVASLGWRWVYAINVPVGCLAVIAGRYLLPRTRTRAQSAGFDMPGVLLLLGLVAGVLTAASALSGLGMPGWTPAALVAFAIACALGLWQWERRTRPPLIDPALFAHPPLRRGLIGAWAAYLVLFGPLALFPQVGAVGAVGTGLLLTALPAGFAVAAVGGTRVLPSRWRAECRERIGAIVMVAATAALAIAPAMSWWVAVWLAVLGVGLGMFIPGNNAAIMTAVPEHRSGTAGGLVNMARGLGTAGGVAVVTLSLHLCDAASLPGDGARVAMTVLSVVAVAALITAGERHPEPS